MAILPISGPQAVSTALLRTGAPYAAAATTLGRRATDPNAAAEDAAQDADIVFAEAEKAARERLSPLSQAAAGSAATPGRQEPFPSPQPKPDPSDQVDFSLEALEAARRNRQE
jgi:hypothetical protein